MKGKLSLLVGGAIGYVLGTRAGREQYDKIVTQAQGLWGHPKVQDAKAQAQDFAKQKGPEVGQKVADKVGGSGSGTTGTSSSTTSTTGSTTGAAAGTTPTGSTTPPPTTPPPTSL